MATDDLAIGASHDLALPPSRLNRLLTAYLNPHLRLEDAAESLNLTLLDFIAQLEHPDVERALARIARAKARRAEHLALNAHDSAVAALVRLVESDKATGPVRAAASALLRRIREWNSASLSLKPKASGRGRGEGSGASVPLSSTSSDRATDSDAASAEKSAPTPSPRSEGGTVEEALRLDRVVASPTAPDLGAAGFSPRSRTEPRKSQAA